MTKSYRIAAAFALLWSVVSAATCFYPDGITKEPNHVPCNATASISSCCAPGDVCTTSGICLGNLGFNYRGSCTDPSFQSPLCASQCHVDPFNNLPYASSTALVPCDQPGTASTNFCCNSPTRNCCSIATFPYTDTGFAFKAGTDLLDKNSMGGVATQSTPALGVLIAVAIGAPLLILVAGGLAFLFWRERRRGTPARTPISYQKDPFSPINTPLPPLPMAPSIKQPKPAKTPKAVKEAKEPKIPKSPSSRGRSRNNSRTRELNDEEKIYTEPGPPPKPPVSPVEKIKPDVNWQPQGVGSVARSQSARGRGRRQGINGRDIRVVEFDLGNGKAAGDLI